ncbi:MAG: hypothetical protein Q8N88_05640 [Nanoarchaeota archaeon]|nr:hypothetical protein [Nanoarchaeota archaeon]
MHGLEGYDCSRNCDNLSDLTEVVETLEGEERIICVVDKRLVFYEKIEEYLKEKHIKIYNFEGNFKEILQPIIENYPIIEDEEEPELKEELIIQTEYVKREIVSEKVFVDKYTPLYGGVENSIIAFVSPFKRSGCSFLTSNLAAHFAKYNISTAVISLPNNFYHFRLIGIDRLCEKKKEEYISPHHCINDGGIYKRNEFVYEKISWVAPDPRFESLDFESWQTDKVSKMIYYSKAPIKLIDVGSYDGIHLEEILTVADEVIVVIDPDPMAIMERDKELQYFVELGKQLNVTFLVNEYAKGVVLESILNTKYIGIPTFERSLIYPQIYDYKLPYYAIESEFDKAIWSISGKYIPKELLGENKETENVFKKIKNIIKR